MRWGGWKLKRQYIAVAAVFAVLLAVSLASFARLMVEQLSRSYMEDVLLSGKAQAEELARRLEGKGNLYKAVETQREALAQISAALSRQQVIDKVQVFNEQGKLVWKSEFLTEGVKGGFPQGNLELSVPIAPVKVSEKTKTYEFRARPEEIGTVVLSVSKPAIATRIAILRRRLLLNAALGGGTSLLVLLGAVVFSWHLVKRNAQLDAKRRLHEELAALGSLAANLAHEIRNPLNAISINLELLEEDLESRKTPVETVGMARREVGRLSRLVNDFLVYARPSAPVLETFDAGALLRDVSALIAPACDRAGVELVVAGDGVTVRADRGQLSQVVMNLALNAIQAMDGGAVRRVELTARRDGDRVVLEVADTGPGIVKSELARVREAFFTRRKGGTGLGLAIADRIVAAHGGTLELANRPQGGLVATVSLPAVNGG